MQPRFSAVLLLATIAAIGLEAQTTTPNYVVVAGGDCSNCRIRRSNNGALQMATCLRDDNGTINDCQVIEIADYKEICVPAGTLVSLDPCGGGLAGPPDGNHCLAPCIQLVNASSLLLRLHRLRV